MKYIPNFDQKPIPNFDQIVHDSKGLWLSGLFGSVVGWNSGYHLIE
jgi:hypothetical protein